MVLFSPPISEGTSEVWPLNFHLLFEIRVIPADSVDGIVIVIVIVVVPSPGECFFTGVINDLLASVLLFGSATSFWYFILLQRRSHFRACKFYLGPGVPESVANIALSFLGSFLHQGQDHAAPLSGGRGKLTDSLDACWTKVGGFPGDKLLEHWSQLFNVVVLEIYMQGQLVVIIFRDYARTEASSDDR